MKSEEENKTEDFIFVFEETFNTPDETASIFDLLSLQKFSHD